MELFLIFRLFCEKETRLKINLKKVGSIPPLFGAFSSFMLSLTWFACKCKMFNEIKLNQRFVQNLDKYQTNPNPINIHFYLQPSIKIINESKQFVTKSRSVSNKSNLIQIPFFTFSPYLFRTFTL